MLLRKKNKSLIHKNKKFEEYREKTGISDDNELFNEILNQNENMEKNLLKVNKKLEISEKLKNDLEKQNIQLKDKIFNLSKTNKIKGQDLSDFNVLNKNYKRLKADYEAIKSDYYEIKKNPIIKEKIIIKEDSNIVKELKVKNDKLESKLREKTANAQKIGDEKKELKNKIDDMEKKRAKIYGLLVRLEKEEKSPRYLFSAEYLNSGEVNKLMRSKVDFLRYKKIKSPSLAVLLEDISETPRSIFLNTNKDKSSLNEISIPNFQYEKFMEIGRDFQKIEEKFESLNNDYNVLIKNNNSLKEKYNQLKTELDKLKDNPIVTEKIIYKEDTKQIDEIKLERDFLRSKLLKLEKGIDTKKAAMVEIGEIYDVRIDGVGRGGDCYTKINNLVIFVPNSKLNEEVKIEITKVFKRYAFAKKLEL